MGDKVRMNERGLGLATVLEGAPALEPELVAPAMAGPGFAPTHASLFRDYASSLRLYFRRRLGDEADSEDAVQDVYLRLLQYCDGGAVRSPPALVFSVARSVLLDRRRRRRTHCVDQHVELQAVELADPDADQERDACVEQELALLERAIAGLTPKCRRVFLLSRLHHLTYPEIAAQLGLSVQMVAKHISNALAACRRQLGEQDAGGWR